MCVQRQFYSGTKVWNGLWLSHLVAVGLRVREGILGERTSVWSPVLARHSTCVILSHAPHNVLPLVPAEENGIVDWWEGQCLLTG